MPEMQTITTFLGWCSIINIGVLMFTGIWLMAFRNLTKSLHSALLGVDQDSLNCESC